MEKRSKEPNPFSFKNYMSNSETSDMPFPEASTSNNSASSMSATTTSTTSTTSKTTTTVSSPSKSKNKTNSSNSSPSSSSHSPRSNYENALKLKFESTESPFKDFENHFPILYF